MGLGLCKGMMGAGGRRSRIMFPRAKGGEGGRGWDDGVVSVYTFSHVERKFPHEELSSLARWEKGSNGRGARSIPPVLVFYIPLEREGGACMFLLSSMLNPLCD